MDITSKVQQLEEKIEKLSSALTILQKSSDTKDAIISSQASEIERLTFIIQGLTALSPIRKTSQNSHQSPSQDISRKNQSLREKSDKPVGGQKGHTGHTLKMTKTPDEVKKLVPCFCNKCGSDLAGLPNALVSCRQVIDIPPIVPTTIEYQSFGVQCSCGHHQVGTYPEGVSNHVQYGKNIQSLIVYFNIYQFLPFKRLCDFFKNVCSLPLSKGTVENIIRRTAKKAEPAYENLRQAIEIAFFVGSDETGAKANKKKLWFWVWQNRFVTYIVAALSRSKQVIIDTFPHGLPNTIVCSDRLAAQLSTIKKGSQICLAHLLRDLNYLIASEKTDWANTFKTLLQEAIELKRQQTHYLKDDPKVKNIEQRLDDLLDQSLVALGWTTETHHGTITFLNAMVKLKDAIFPFLYHKEVQPDNNSSERAIRNIKIKTKVSGQFKSLHQEFAILRSLIDTAIKNGQGVFNAIQNIVNLSNRKAAG
jgi:transposase